jgi:hypothetical protein
VKLCKSYKFFSNNDEVPFGVLTTDPTTFLILIMHEHSNFKLY